MKLLFSGLKTKPLVAAYLLFLAAGSTSFAGQQASTQASASTAQANVEESIQAFDCIVTPYQVADLSSPVQGVLNKVYVERSDFVRRGQVVAELVSDVEKASVELASARAAIESELKVSAVNLAFDKRRKSRFDSLFEKDAVSQQNKDEVDREAELSVWKHRQAQELEHIRQLELQKTQQQLNQKIVRSTFDGFVIEKFKTTGEYVEDQPILRVAQLDPLNIEVIIPMNLFGKIKVGMMAQVYPETAHPQLHLAKVAIVDRMGDVGSGTFGVRLELPNPDYRVPAGLKCELKFIDEQTVATQELGADLAERATVAEIAPQQPATTANHRMTGDEQPQPL